MTPLTLSVKIETQSLDNEVLVVIYLGTELVGGTRMGKFSTEKDYKRFAFSLLKNYYDEM